MITVKDNAKRIRFIQNCNTYEGEYLGKKKHGNMTGLSKGRVYYRVRVIFSEEEFSIYNVEREEVIEVIY